MARTSNVSAKRATRSSLPAPPKHSDTGLNDLSSGLFLALFVFFFDAAGRAEARAVDLVFV